VKWYFPALKVVACVYEHNPPEQTALESRFAMSTALLVVCEYTTTLYRLAPSEAFHLYVGVVSAITPLGETKTGAAGLPYLNFIHALAGPQPTAFFALTLKRYSPWGSGVGEVYLHTPYVQALLPVTFREKTVLPLVTEYKVTLYFVAVVTLFHL
jgi:hypothetical protein